MSHRLAFCQWPGLCFSKVTLTIRSILLHIVVQKIDEGVLRKLVKHAWQQQYNCL
jgi:hypothetical protein